MSNFISDSSSYNICSENEVVKILSHFNSDYIYNIMEHNLDTKNTISILKPINLVYTLEQNFKQLLAEYPHKSDEINNVREETFNEIIDKIENRYNLTVNFESDIYTIAYVMYDFFVCNFSSHMISFYSTFILKEKNSICEALNLNDLKKNRDSTTLYFKKIYKDTKIAVIVANIDKIIDAISTYDIKLSNIFDTVLSKNISYLISESIIDNNDNFLRNEYNSIIQSNIYRADYITNIRLNIQSTIQPQYEIGEN